MDLERIRRKIVALENKNQVTFASISGSTRSLSHNGTEIVIDNGDAVCNGNVIAENLREDNEERLTACEIAIANMDDRYAKKEHTHFISDIINLQEILDQIMSSIGSGDSPNIKVGPFNINVNGGGGGSITGDYASKEVYDYVDDEEGKRTATIKASEGLKVNDVPVSMEGHTHLLNDIDNIEELDDLYADIDHNHDDKYATFAALDYKANVEHTHLLEDIDDIDTLDELYAAKDHDHTSTNITDKINEYDKGTVVDDTYLINEKDPAEYYPDISLLVEDDHVKLFFSGDNYSNQYISFNYKNQEYGPPPFSDNIGEWHYEAGENDMKLWFDHDVEVNDITVKIREETYVIHGMPPHEEITDMTSKSVITANAVKGYTENNFAPKVHTHVSEDITDKINDISFNNTVNKEWVLQEGTIFTKGSSPDGLEIRRSCTNDLSFNIYYNYDEASIQYSTMNSTIDFNGLKINKGSNEVIILAPESVAETMTLFLTNITVDSEPKPNEKVIYKYITSSITTDMSSKDIITANAVKEYVDYQLANIESIPNLSHDHDDEYAPIDHVHIPNIFYQENYWPDTSSLPGKATIPICKANSEYFQCRVLTWGNGGSDLLLAFDIIYMNKYPKFGFITSYVLNASDISQPNASLVKVTTTDDQEIICLRVLWSEMPVIYMSYTIISNQSITGDEIEIASETELPNFEFYSILKDHKTKELVSSTKDDFATEGAVVTYLNSKIATLESRIAALEAK